MLFPLLISGSTSRREGTGSLAEPEFSEVGEGLVIWKVPELYCQPAQPNTLR